MEPLAGNGGLKKERALVFVGAHPDDESFGIGGVLAQYAAAGIKVYYVCATRGEAGTVASEHLIGHATLGDLRWSELKCAARILGLADVIYLGYRDSGMPGSEDNQHPQALAMAPLEQVAGRVVKTLRELKPDVVVTFDPIGGYRHPDHIAVHKATVEAFRAAGDPGRYPEAGPAFEPRKLYFAIFSRMTLKLMVKLMPLFGQDPRRFGRNKDIDLASIASARFPAHAVVRLTKQSVRAWNEAAACHASQLGGSPRGRGLFGILDRLFGRRSMFMRAYPPVQGRRRETDLFEGVP